MSVTVTARRWVIGVVVAVTLTLGITQAFTPHDEQPHDLMCQTSPMACPQVKP